VPSSLLVFKSKYAKAGMLLAVAELRQYSCDWPIPIVTKVTLVPEARLAAAHRRVGH
jgi:hypothetical protein